MTVPRSMSDKLPDAAGRSGAAATRMADQHMLCTECARKGHSCCHAHDIYVTWGDCRRIFRHTRRKDFFEYRPCASSAYADQDDDPLWKQHVFRSDGTRRVLRQDAKGDCMLLTPAGCSLPLAVRPLICRLYPHVYSAAGIAWEWDLECPATRSFSAAAIESGIAGVSRSEAAQWHQLLYDEVLWEGLVDENWIDL